MLSDRIREFANEAYIAPARAKGEVRVSIRAGDVKDAMSLHFNRQPAVCSALGSTKFEKLCHVRRVGCEGPLQGANLVLTFEILA